MRLLLQRWFLTLPILAGMLFISAPVAQASWYLPYNSSTPAAETVTATPWWLSTGTASVFVPASPASPVTTWATTPATTTSQATPSQNQSSSAQVQQMLNLINQFRAQAGAPPLTLNSGLSDAATMKSQDMVTNNYFSHFSPTWGTTFNLEAQLGLQAGGAENIAEAKSVQWSMYLLEASHGHRVNLLNPAYTKVGLGIVNTPYGVTVTQLFQ